MKRLSAADLKDIARVLSTEGAPVLGADIMAIALGGDGVLTIDDRTTWQFASDDGREFLFTIYSDASVELAERARPGDVWGPPMPCTKTDSGIAPPNAPRTVEVLKGLQASHKPLGPNVSGSPVKNVDVESGAL